MHMKNYFQKSLWKWLDLLKRLPPKNIYAHEKLYLKEIMKIIESLEEASPKKCR